MTLTPSAHPIAFAARRPSAASSICVASAACALLLVGCGASGGGDWDVAPTSCEAGEFMATSETGARVCTPLTVCAAGERVAAQGSETADQQCAPCASGTYSDTDNADACASWTACGLGAYVVSPGSVTADQVCAPCAAGSFSDGDNAASCAAWTTCSAGQELATPGSATSDQVCTPCADGTYSDTAGACAPWTVCAAGQAVATPASARADRTCTDCADGTFTDQENAGSCEAWTVCAPGTYVASASDAAHDRVCSACPSGSYSDAPNAESCTAWTACAPGQYITIVGDPTADQTCSDCAAGTFSEASNATNCVAWTTCMPGTFVTSPGSASADRTCSPCTNNTFSVTLNAPTCVAWTTCRAGAYVSKPATAANDRVCTSCGAGTYSATTNAATCAAWTSCTAGQFVSSDGSATSDQTCTACGVGFYSDASNAASCSVCPVGTYAGTAGSAACTPCDAGTANNTLGAAACTTCADGSYSDGTGAALCSPWSVCVAGTFVSTSGTTTSDQACDACAVGTFSGASNTTSCTPCPLGTYMGTTGAIACTPCAPTTYSDAPGAVLCASWTSCAAGDYVSTPGTSSNNQACTACTSGSFSSTTDAPTCTAWTACGDNSAETQAPSNISDRGCACLVGFADLDGDGHCHSCAVGYYTYPACERPNVVGTSPADGDAAVEPTAAVEIWFGTAMAPSTLAAQTSPGLCSGSVQVSLDGFATCIAMANPAATMSGGGTVATFTPAPALSAGTLYAVRVTVAVETVDGTPLATQYDMVSGFSTSVAGASCGNGPVVIGEVYPGGGNSGATYDQDFVVLRNRTAVDVDLTGWTLQYSSPAGTSWASNSTPLGGIIAAGGYHLVGLAGGATGGPLPSLDGVGTTNMGMGGGKLALVNDAVGLTGPCPAGATVVDMVGWGSATCSEMAPTGSVGSTESLARGGVGCVDTDGNAADFVIAPVDAPPGSGSAPSACSCANANASGLAAEADWCVVQSPLSIAVTAGASTGLIYARVYESGVTLLAGGSPGVWAQIGYGPATINPTTEAGWVWSDASFNAQYGNDDEYMANLSAPALPGAYLYGARFSLDSGASWTTCDLDGAGSNAGLTFDVAQLPPLVVAP